MELRHQLDASASFSYQHTSVCFFGHTHAPRAYIRDGPVMSIPLDKIKLTVEKAHAIHGRIDVLINNAGEGNSDFFPNPQLTEVAYATGYALFGTFEETT